jgi:hypothetical protein
MAVSGNGYAVSWDGSAWSAPVNVVGPAYGFSSVSCPTNGTCVAVSNNAVGYYSSGKWSATEGVDDGSYVSCPDKNFCISVGAGAWRYQGGTWSGPVVLAIGPDDVSCPARNFCMAVDGNGNAVSYS